MPLWVGDFLADTMDLDAAEVGAYMLLIMAQWKRDGGSLPNDQRKLQRVARCGRNWPKVWAVIGRYFKEDAAGVFSQKCREVSQNVAAKREVNKQSGARGGSAKALKIKQRDLADATISLQRNPTISESYPEREKREGDKSPSCAIGFDDFWAACPRKIGKVAAQKAYVKAMRWADQKTLLNGIVAYAESRRGQDPQYTAHPATWLNAGRWEDEKDKPRDMENGHSRGDGRLRAFLAGAGVKEGLGSGQDSNPPLPLLARR